MNRLPETIYLVTVRRTLHAFDKYDEALEFLEECQSEWPDGNFHMFKTKTDWTGAVHKQLTLW